VNITDIKYCPIHGTSLPCKECSPQEKDNAINYIMAVSSCERINPSNAGRVAVSITALYDVLKATEKYLVDFEQTMVGAGIAKKRGELHPTDLTHRVEKLQTELYMWVMIARQKIGDINDNKTR
jgi:hypothetical protein